MTRHARLLRFLAFWGLGDRLLPETERIAHPPFGVGLSPLTLGEGRAVSRPLFRRRTRAVVLASLRGPGVRIHGDLLPASHALMVSRQDDASGFSTGFCLMRSWVVTVAMLRRSDRHVRLSMGCAHRDIRSRHMKAA